MSSISSETSNSSKNYPEPLTQDEYQARREAADEQPGLSLTRTETVKSLHELGITSEVPTPDINNPLKNEAPIFPEEYTLETPSGLVPLKTLQSIGRTQSNITLGSKKEEAEKEKIEFVTFKVDDPENPHNWSPLYRWSYTLFLSVFVICAAYGSSCLADGLGPVQDHFHVLQEVAILTVSLMVLGFSVGPLIWAPLSEQIGRKPVYVISFGLYVIFNIPCALAPNIGALLVCRFLCGVFSSSALTNVGASIVDMHNETRSLAIAFFSFAPYSGPVFGAVVNGFITNSTGRFDIIVWVNMAFAGVMWIAICLLPETYAPAILKSRAKKLRKETGNPNIMTEQESVPLSLRQLINENLVLPLRFIIEEPVLDLTCAFVALIYSLLYAFFFAYPVIFEELYGFGENYIGLMYIPILIGALLALTTTYVIEKLYQSLVKRRKPQPEDRLVGAMIGSPFPCIALFILGATSYKHIIWVGPASSGLAFGYGMVLIYYSLNNYIIDSYAKNAASALATKVFLRSSGGAAFPLFTTQMYHKLGLQWASWLLAFISLAMIAIPFAFYKYGATLRAKLGKKDYSISEYL